jgi:hypothetical protein
VCPGKPRTPPESDERPRQVGRGRAGRGGAGRGWGGAGPGVRSPAIRILRPAPRAPRPAAAAAAMGACLGACSLLSCVSPHPATPSQLDPALFLCLLPPNSFFFLLPNLTFWVRTLLPRSSGPFLTRPPATTPLRAGRRWDCWCRRSGYRAGGVGHAGPGGEGLRRCPSWELGRLRPEGRAEGALVAAPGPRPTTQLGVVPGVRLATPSRSLSLCGLPGPGCSLLCAFLWPGLLICFCPIQVCRARSLSVCLLVASRSLAALSALCTLAQTHSCALPRQALDPFPLGQTGVGMGVGGSPCPCHWPPGPNFGLGDPGIEGDLGVRAWWPMLGDLGGSQLCFGMVASIGEGRGSS